MMETAENDRRTTQSQPHTKGHLAPVTGRPPIPTYLRQLWERRFFIQAEARAKVYAGSRNLILGRVWLVLSPLLDAAVYGLMFGFLLRTSRGVDSFIPYLLVGICFFSFTSRSLNGGAGLIFVRRNFIRAFAFPRAALVLSHSLKFLYDTLPVILVTLILVVWFPGGHGTGKIHWTWVIAPLIFAFQILFNTGLMFLSASLTHLIPDLKQLLPYLTRLWFYASGVFFSIDVMAAHHPRLLTVLQLNPAYVNLTMIRQVLIYGQVPSTDLWIQHISWALGVFVIGFIVFWRREVEYARG